MSPCIASAANPRPPSFSASSAAPFFVRRKISTASRLLQLQHLRQHFELLPLGDVEKALLDVGRGDVVMLDLHALRIDEMPLRDAQRLGSGIVAEKSATCRGVGTSESIRSTSSMKPIFSISSASSSTTMRTLAEIERAAVEVIDEPSRRADDDVRAALQMLHLPEDRRAAVDGEHGRRRRVSSRTNASPRRPAWPARASA